MHPEDTVKGLVSIIIPTKNSSLYLRRCLDSLTTQTYKAIEIIVSDNGSTDETCEIAAAYGAVVLHSGSERSKQLNAALQACKGEFAYRVDSDFIVDKGVVEEAVRLCECGADAVAVHNDSSPENGFWAKVRRFERAMYRDDDLIVGARFMRTAVIRSIGGFDETLVAGEDYDLHNRLLAKGYSVARTLCGELHLGEPRSLREIWSKNFYYGQTILCYVRLHPRRALAQSMPVRGAYFRNWRAFVEQPFLALGFVTMLCAKYAGCIAGASFAFLTLRRSHSGVDTR